MLFCNTGQLSPYIASYGIMPHDAEDKNVCMAGFGDTKDCQNRVSSSFLDQYHAK